MEGVICSMTEEQGASRRPWTRHRHGEIPRDDPPPVDVTPVSPAQSTDDDAMSGKVSLEHLLSEWRRMTPQEQDEVSSRSLSFSLL